MQGWTPDFIPKLGTDAIDAGLIDEIAPINGADAIRLSKELAQKEGIFVGISAGATLAGALEVARRSPKGTSILCMLPDTGERYLSTPLFEDISKDMTAEEVEIAQSTPRYRFDATGAPSPQPAAAAKPEPAKPEAIEFVDEVLSSPREPVVLFALEWCEFSWSVRKMFAEYDIPYRSIDLDSVAYQKDNWGGDVRAALHERISIPTIPQIFVGGEHIGGATETFDAFNAGKLQDLLDKNGVAMAEKEKRNAYSFMPGWLHPR